MKKQLSDIEKRWKANKVAIKGKRLKFDEYPSTVGEAFPNQKSEYNRSKIEIKSGRLIDKMTKK